MFKRPQREQSAAGFTLIELLVVVTLIAILVGLILPAVQSTRGAARRASCANNLMQLALACQNYAASFGVFPVGSYQMLPPGDPLSAPCNGRHEHSIFIRLLPFQDQAPLYNTFNANIHYFTPANTTVIGTALRTLWCPADPKVAQSSLLPGGSDASVSFPQAMPHNSYMGSSGTWFSPGRYQDPRCKGVPFAQLLAQANGVFYYYSGVGPADIRDGMSNTMLLAEGPYGVLDGVFLEQWHWWASGNYADTMYTTLYPLNPIGKTNAGAGAANVNSTVAASAAGSFHPGGANFALCDGSVRFITDAVESLPANPATNMPLGVTDSNGLYSQTVPNAVYQALSTRAGGEAISADSY